MLNMGIQVKQTMEEAINTKKFNSCNKITIERTFS